MSDLRYHSDELADAMSTAFEGGLGPGEAVEREMVWGGKQTLVEKNVRPSSRSLIVLMPVVAVLSRSFAEQDSSLPTRALLLVP